MKKTICIISFILLILFLTSCDTKSRYEYIPDESEFAEWDGNYFYYGNYRCKTDLTEEETYISELVIDDKTFEIKELYDYEFYNDKIYMTCSIDDGYTSGTYYKSVYYSVFLIYSFESNEVEYVYKNPTENKGLYASLNDIAMVDDAYVIISGNGCIRKLDLTTNEITDKLCSFYEVKYGYIAFYASGVFYIGNSEDFRFKSIKTVDDWQNVYRVIDFFIFEKDGKILLEIIVKENISKTENASLDIYDFEKDKLYNFINLSDKRTISYNSIIPYIFIVGKERVLQYQSKYESKEIDFVGNNILYTINVDEAGVSLNEIEKYSADNEYKIGTYKNGFLSVRARLFVKSSNSDYYNEVHYYDYQFNVKELKFMEYFGDLEQILIYEDDEFKYYFKIDYIPSGILSRETVFYLYKYDKNTKREFLLQFFFENSAGGIGDEFYYLLTKYGDSYMNEFFIYVENIN